MTVDRGIRNGRWMVLVTLAACAVCGRAQAASFDRFDNGIHVTVHGAQELAGYLQAGGDGRLYLDHPVAGRLELAAGKDAAWIPLSEVQVVEALKDMQGFTTAVAVDVFILPAPPADEGSSFARGGAIFLAPATGPVADETVAYVTVHEMGHVLTWAFIDGQPGRWETYLQLRGLDGGAYGPEARHADRPREILAEDLRHLFGGGLATASGTIENHDLVLPDRVAGLTELLRRYISGRAATPVFVPSSAAPNPCNPLTTISMDLPDAVMAEAELQIFDIRGRHVRTLRGAGSTSGRVALRWDGTDDAGGGVASGRYFYVMTAAGLTARGSVTLVR